MGIPKSFFRNEEFLDKLRCFSSVVIPQYINKMTTKLKWTQDQQKYLAQIREEVGENRWVDIAKALNTKFEGKIRTGKQCRQRFLNFLQAEGTCRDSSAWSGEQTKNLFKMFLEKGPRWTEIAKQLTGRSENTVKNKFYSSLRKFTRCLNIHSKHKGRENLKPLKMESLNRILNLSEEQLGDNVKALDAIIRNYMIDIEIKSQILGLASMEQNPIDLQRVEQLGEQIRLFNSEFRTFLIRQYRKQNSKNHKESRPKKKEENFVETIDKTIESNIGEITPTQMCSQSKKLTAQMGDQNEAGLKGEHIRFHYDTYHPSLYLVDDNQVKDKRDSYPQNLEKEYCDIIDQIYNPVEVFYPN